LQKACFLYSGELSRAPIEGKNLRFEEAEARWMMTEEVKEQTPTQENTPTQPNYGTTGLVPPPQPMGPAKNEMNPTLLIAVLGAGIGLMVGLIFAMISWRGSTANGPYDLKTVDASGYGLKGHLYTKWDNRLGYRLTIEPDDPARRDGFSLAVRNSPRPLAIDIQLHDPLGFVLCSKTILLKYDPKAALAHHDQRGGTGNASISTGTKVDAGVDVAKLEAAELQREMGKDVFQATVGSDGKIDSLDAQGQLGCSMKEYGNAASWSFLPDFPTTSEQAAMVKPATAREEAAAPADNEHRRAKKKAAETASPFYIEGNDAIVAYDASSGALQLGFGKFFFLDKSGPEAKIVEEQDLPVKVYYKCDQGGMCTLAHTGAFVLHVRTRQ
jgi:hypothetical protein